MERPRIVRVGIVGSRYEPADFDLTLHVIADGATDGSSQGTTDLLTALGNRPAAELAGLGFVVASPLRHGFASSEAIIHSLEWISARQVDIVLVALARSEPGFARAVDRLTASGVPVFFGDPPSIQRARVAIGQLLMTARRSR